MTTYVINRSAATLPVEVEFPEQPARPKEFIFIQAKSKAILPRLSRVTFSCAHSYSSELVITQIDNLGEPSIS